MKGSLRFAVLTLLLQGAPAYGEAASLRLSLAEAEQQALAQSRTVAAASARLDGAVSQRRVKEATTKPRVTLDGSYTYLSQVPKVDVGPASIQLGQHNNYSVGPTVAYKVYDGGVDTASLESLDELVEARWQDRVASDLQVTLEARAAYAGVQLGAEELRLVAESLRLSGVRERDIKNRVTEGAANRLDLLAVQREEIDLRRRFEEAQARLAESVRHLVFLTGADDLPTPLLPVGFGLATKLPKGLKAPTLVLIVDGIDASESRLRSTAGVGPSATHPSVASLTHRERAARLEAVSHEREGLPTVKVFAASTYGYPNGPLDERVWQNSVGVAVSMPRYDGGLRHGEQEEKLAEAKAAGLEREQLERDLRERWQNGLTQLASLDSQTELAGAEIAKAKQEARLTESDYRAGASTYLDVQRANNKVLEAEFTLLRLQTEGFRQLMTLNYLAARNP